MTTQKPVALVTGASSGIGEATANKLAAAGYKVYGTSRRGGQAGKRPFPMLALDVTDDASVAAAVDELLQREGRIDLLVNNAGFGVAPAGAEESSIEQAKAILDTNFLGIVRMTRAIVPHMRQQGSGRIINIGSILGVIPVPYAALYVASKHAVEGYSEALDQELRTRGIRVTVIEPAYTRTQFDVNNVEPDAKLEEYQNVRTHLAKVVGQAMLNGDDPEVVAEVVLRVARTERPKLRYTAGKAARRLQLLRRFAPASLMDAGVRKSLQLDGKGSAPDTERRRGPATVGPLHTPSNPLHRVDTRANPGEGR
jgi:NAD(P)-dependent dehydrogenase (short-subunit alcohol dehydrogenase family)